MPIRVRVQNIGGPFPGKGAAPTMAHDKILPRGTRAAFEALNDAAAMRPTITDAGSLVAANDNKPEREATRTRPSRELRLTKTQADFLRSGEGSVHRKVNDRTELILGQRKMLAWRRLDDGAYGLGLSAKGEAALSRYRNRETRG
ncbi:hypothetical protein [Rhizobium mongolense]|uniref:Uncharacterized protein n=1 Tax=Rhizobium mongolense TaxID=57676 RepID=A0A7W6RI84_9HYPH|nr:hypothetical protein [Rhizobium mongolense]MBB4272774.1 hypothetical protein [Rhizobium mongolense]